MVTPVVNGVAEFQITVPLLVNVNLFGPVSATKSLLVNSVNSSLVFITGNNGFGLGVKLLV